MVVECYAVQNSWSSYPEPAQRASHQGRNETISFQRGMLHEGRVTDLRVHQYTVHPQTPDGGLHGLGDWYALGPGRFGLS